MDRLSLTCVAALLAGCVGQAQAELPVSKTPAQWAEQLSDLEYKVLREQGTEPAYSGEFWDHHEAGVYTCGGCGQPLFPSDTKFESGTGWPSFYRPIAANSIQDKSDRAFGMLRTEVSCSRCGGHLGHVFADGPKPTGQRYCINSASLDFVPAKE